MESLNFKKYGMKIHLNKITAVIGPASCGKTTIFKLLANKVNNDSVYLDRKKLNDYNIDFLRKNVMTIFDFESFNRDYVKEELAFYLRKLKIENSEVSSRLAQFRNYFKLDDIIDCKIDFLNVEEKCFIKILSFLIVNPMILGVDNLFSYISHERTNLIMKYIKEHNISLIYTSTDPENIEYADEVKVINKFKLVKSGTTSDIFKDNVIKDLKLEIPFLSEINEYLKYYDLVDEDFASINECVGALWK